MNTADITAVTVDASGVVRSLGEAGITTTVVSEFDSTPLFLSRYCRSKHQIPGAVKDPEGFVEGLLRIGKHDSNPPVFFPAREVEVELLARHHERLAPHFRFKIPDVEMVEQLCDKSRFVELAEHFFLAIPRSWRLQSDGEVVALRNEVPFPVVLKPLHQEAWMRPEVYRLIGRWKKAVLVSNPEEFDRLVDLLCPFSPELVVQEYISGPDDRLYDFHAYCSQPGKADGYFCWHKLRTYPPHFGHVSYAESDIHDEVIRQSLETLEKLQFVGPANLDYKIDARTGRIVLFEINPRFAFTAHFATQCGVNLPLAHYNDCLGKPLPPLVQTRLKRRWQYFYLDISALSQYRRERAWTWRSWCASLWAPRLSYYRWDVRDPLPLIGAFFGYLRERLRWWMGRFRRPEKKRALRKQSDTS